MNRPRIVVVDGHAANPGDLSWAELESLGEMTIHPRTAREQVVGRCANAELVLTNKVVFDREMLGQLSGLRYIGVTATGHNIVDGVAAKERGIVVTNVPAYSTMSVAQLTFALLLELTHRVGDHARGVQGGKWTASPDFAYWDYPLTELDGLTMGLIGYGSIGRAVAGIAQALGMRVIYHSRSGGVDLETLLRQSDVVSLHCPLTPQTTGLINATRLAWMKPSAFLINTGRGPLLVEQDVADALNAGRLAGAGMDVLSVEPPPASNPLLTAKNCLITPHFGWATRAARVRLLREVTENVRAFLAGRARNVVN